MSIRFRCKNCNQKYELENDCSGDTLDCIICKNKMLVPLESEIPPNISIKTTASLTNLAHKDEKEKIQEIRISSSTAKNKAPDDIIFRCKICNQKYRLPKSIGGQIAECAKCKKNMIVPKQSDNAPASVDNEEKIIFWCKSCGQKYRLPKELAGEEGECTKCHKTFEVPEESEELASISHTCKTVEKATAVVSFIPVSDKNKDKIQKISIHSATAKNKAPDDIIFRCKVCNQKYRLAKQFGGQLAECAKCKRNMIVPSQSDSPAAGTTSQEKVIFWCKSCGQKYRLPKELAGQEGECAKCNKVFEVPAQSEPQCLMESNRTSAPAENSVPAAKKLETSEKSFQSASEPLDQLKHFLPKAPAVKAVNAPLSPAVPPIAPKAPRDKYPERDAEKTQTSISMTKTARAMVKYVLEIPERNFIFACFSLLIDWLMQLKSLNRMPRKLVIFLLIFATLLAGIITYSTVKIYQQRATSIPKINVMCASCKLCETRQIKNIFTTKCSKCKGQLGFQWKCSYCNRIFTRIEKKTDDNSIQYENIDKLNPPVCPFCNSNAVKYFAPPKPESPGQPKKNNIRSNSQ